MLLGDILLRFRADTSEFDRGLSKVEAAAQAFGQRADRSGYATIPARMDPSGMESGMRAGEASALSWAQSLAATIKNQLTQAVPFTISGYLTQTINRTYGMVKGSILGMNSTLEDTTLQFTSLMKDADKAREHVLDLFEFAKLTPFETQPIILASRLMQTFGGNALNTKEELLRVGNAAAVASRPINEVGFWYGRLYSAIQNGQPFGESAMRMQEMGIMSGDVRLKLEALQKSGASGADIWAEWQKAMDENDGAMKRMAGTMSGLTSTIADTVQISGSRVFKPLFDLAKQGLMLVVSVLDSGEFNGMIDGMTTGFAKIMGTVQAGLEALVPVAGAIYGFFEPLVAAAWEWGSGFVSAFAGGISSAVSTVFSALTGLAGGIADLLQPHSPPKILPDLDKWGLKAAQVWMEGWKGADYRLFGSIGASIKKALNTAVGAGKLGENQELPVLAQTRAALAELMSKRGPDKSFDADLLAKVGAAAGPAGEAVVELTDAYLRLDWASERAARAQEELNEVTDHYSAILDPLHAQLGGVRRQMSLIREQQRLQQIQQKLATATGAERQMLLLEQQEIALQRQITTQEAARDGAARAAQEKIQVAKELEARAGQELSDIQAKHDLEAESIATAKQQVALLERLAKAAGASAQAGQQASNAVVGAIDDAKTEIGKMQARVAGLTEQFGKARERAKAMFTPVTEGARIAESWFSRLGKASGLTELAGSARFLLTGQFTDSIKDLIEPGNAMGKMLIAWRYQLVRVGQDARAGIGRLWAALKDTGTYLTSGEMNGALLRLFGPDTPVLRGIMALRYRITSIKEDTILAAKSIKNAVLTMATGQVAGPIFSLDPDGVAVQTLTQVRARLGQIREITTFLAGGAASGWIAGLLAQGGPATDLLIRVRDAVSQAADRLQTMGTEAVGRFQQGVAFLNETLRLVPVRLQAMATAMAGVFAAFQGGGLRGALEALGGSLWAVASDIGTQVGGGLVEAIPEGVRKRVQVVGPALAAALAGVIGGLTFGPAVAGAIAPISPVLSALAAPLAGLGPLLVGLGTGLATLVARVPAMLAPFGMLRTVFSQLGVTIGLLLQRIPGIRTLFASLFGSLARSGPALLGLFTRLIPTILNVGRTVVGLMTPFGLAVTLVGTFIAAFTSDFGGIRGVVQSTLEPVVPILRVFGEMLRAVVAGVTSGDWASVGAVLRGLFGGLGPLVAQAAGSLQTGLPQIFTIMMQYLAQVGTQLIAWAGSVLPGLIVVLGRWGIALVDWILPMIPPMLAAVGGLIASLLEALFAAAPDIGAALLLFAAEFVDWVLVAGPPLLRQLGGLIARMLGWIADQLPGIAATLAQWAGMFLLWVGPTIPKVISALGGLLGELLTWIVQKAPSILERLGVWAAQFTDWVRTAALPALLIALGTMFAGLWTELQARWKAAWAEGSLGRSLLDSIKTGFAAGWDGFVSWVTGKMRMIPGFDALVEYFGGSQGAGAVQQTKPGKPPPPLSAPPASAPASSSASASMPNAPVVPPAQPRPPGNIEHRATGGFTRAGGAYVVGERGPELFSPATDGMIAPNSIYRAVVSPMAAQAAVLGGAAGASGYPVQRAGYGGGASVSVNVTINNPVVDSAARLGQLKAEIVTDLESRLTTLLRRVVFAEGV